MATSSSASATMSHAVSQGPLLCLCDTVAAAHDRSRIAGARRALTAQTGGRMVDTLDQRTAKLFALAKRRCEELQIDMQWLAHCKEADLESDDEKLLRELLRLIDYIDALR